MEKNNGNAPPSNIADLNTVRTSLAVPTLIAAIIAKRAGARIVALYPGLIRADLSEDSAVRVSIRVRKGNVYRDEANAYRLARLPVPEHVLRDAERWDRTHGSGQ